MKLTSVKGKINNSVRDLISYECLTKTDNSTNDIWREIYNAILILNVGSISRMQRRILDNLKDEIK